MIIETARLYLRELQQSDLDSLSKILQDEQTMVAYEGAFDDTEVHSWLEKQLDNYRREGFGLWAVVLKETNEMIGQCGLTWQDFAGQKVLEIGYLFQRAFWHHGYAIEAAEACKKYAFEQLNAEEFFSIIRDTNTASQKVAERNGMTRSGEFVKHYRGVTMPHYVYSVKK
ncbi:GNAT family N-acetyltransferase [Enterococcus malodoratus]|uniref:GNAT family N-acetyltransferase n=1 Tax=Enterococcus malodoratus TaxID=71451 RepID=UPI002073FC68|nr:GNAT family N-acetyltransferase [Enterococcus malodoratus]